MKRNTILAIVAVLILVGLGLVVAGKKSVVPVVTQVATSTATSTAPSVHATSTITVDWTKVGKDRLYTEEEGKYENLSAGEKEIMRRIAGYPVMENDYLYRYSLLYALHDGYAFLRFGGQKVGLTLGLYDGKNNRSVPLDLKNPLYPFILSSTMLVIVDERRLLYYKAGFPNLVVVPDSQLDEKYSYSFAAGMGEPFADVSTTTKSITVSIYNQGIYWQQEGMPKPLEKKTFHIE